MTLFIVFSVLLIAVNAVPFIRQLDEPFEGKTWVVLAASANTWNNYAMQSDVYHAYQVIHSHGIPDENIIVMHYDDIAFDTSNPTPGIIINKYGGPDVYEGVPKDYTGEDVTPQNFLGILRGDEELVKKGKRVLKSSPNDRVFVYLDDHGAPGYVVFPKSNLMAEDLIQTLTTMHDEHKFKHLVFYLHACHSGSMFENLLPNNISVYAMTATRPDELGWSTPCMEDERRTCLSFKFAADWFSDTENHDLTKESIGAQYDYIAHRYTNQHAQQYGDLSIAGEHLSNYFGDKQVPISAGYKKSNQSVNSVPIPDIPLYLAQRMIENTDELELKQRYVNELEVLLRNRELMDKQIEEYVNSLPGIEANVVLNSKLQINNKECYHKLVDTFHSKCYTLGQNTYAISKMQIFVNICEEMRESSDADINAVNQLLIQYCDTIVKPNEFIV